MASYYLACWMCGGYSCHWVLLIICLGTQVFERVVGPSNETGLPQFLCILTFRLTAVMAIILALVGIVVPWALGYALPESHMADGPWSYEEILGYVVGLFLLCRLHQQVCQGQILNGILMTAVMFLFLGVALLWIGRWDVMANVGQVSSGWFLRGAVQWEWSRVIPKSFHLLFAALATGGMVVVSLGMLGMLAPQSDKGLHDSDSVKSTPNLIRYGVGWILFGLVPQMLIGPWLFLLIQNRPQMILIEGTSLTSLIFFVSLTTALLALVLLNASFMVPHVKGLVWGGMGNVAVTLVLMGIVRYETFGATLVAQKIPFAMAELSGWHILSVFVLLTVVGSLLMRWCVWPSALIFHTTLPTAHLDKTWRGH